MVLSLNKAIWKHNASSQGRLHISLPDIYAISILVIRNFITCRNPCHQLLVFHRLCGQMFEELVTLMQMSIMMWKHNSYVNVNKQKNIYV